MHPRLLLSCLCLGTLALLGCRDEFADRHEITGNVTYKGKPLSQGNIQFIPEGVPGAATGVANVDNGKYEIPKRGGLKPGTYKVVISSAAGTKVKEGEAPGESGPPPKELIPPEYNVNTKQKVEVKPAGPNQFDFTIQ